MHVILNHRFDEAPWKHCLPAVEPLLPDEKEGTDPPHSVENASQVAGLLLLAVPLEATGQ